MFRNHYCSNLLKRRRGRRPLEIRTPRLSSLPSAGHMPIRRVAIRASFSNRIAWGALRGPASKGPDVSQFATSDRSSCGENPHSYPMAHSECSAPNYSGYMVLLPKQEGGHHSDVWPLPWGGRRRSPRRCAETSSPSRTKSLEHGRSRCGARQCGVRRGLTTDGSRWEVGGLFDMFEKPAPWF